MMEAASGLFGDQGLSAWHYDELYARAETILRILRKGSVLPAAEIRVARGICHSWFWDACWHAALAGGGSPFHGSECSSRAEAVSKAKIWIEKKIPHMDPSDANRVRVALGELA